MKVSRKYPIMLGGADTRLLRYEVLAPRLEAQEESLLRI
jgi:hypothetical protein